MNHTKGYSTAENVIYLAKCVVNKVTPERNRVRAMDIQDVYAFAKKHSLSAIVAAAIEMAGFPDEVSRNIRGSAIRRTIVFESEKNTILKELEEAGIWHTLLKGAVIKDLYPEFGIREMADYDILFDENRASDLKAIMERLGYSTESYGSGNHDVYQKPPILNFEMHRQLFSKEAVPVIFSYYTKIRSKLIKDEGTQFSYHFSPDDFYVYMIAHEYKHYSHYGTGLRSLLDIYVYQQKCDLNWDYIDRELNVLGIADFERLNRKLALSLYGDETIENDVQAELENFITSGTYGNLEHFIFNEVTKFDGGKSAKLKFILKRLFPGYSNFEINCPTLSQYKILFPFYLVYRFVKGLLFKRKRIFMELKLLKKTTIQDNDF